jgi:hypothetical protein
MTSRAFGRHARPIAGAGFAAVLLSAVIAGQAFAHSWSARTPFTSSGTGIGDGVAAVNATTAVAVYADETSSPGVWNVYARRTTTSGASWASPQTLSTNGGFDADVSALDPFVDILYTDNDTVEYARSVDGGMTYLAPVALSGSAGFWEQPRISRGPSGLVVAGWIDGFTSKYKVRISTNGGVTFGATKTFNSNLMNATEAIAVAAGDGVVYVGYASTDSKLVIKRTADGGATWSAAVTATNAYTGDEEIDLAASGTHAYFAYSRRNPSVANAGTVRYRRTINSGASWSSEKNLAPSAWDTTSPSVSLESSVLRAAYHRHRTSGFSVYYQQSSTGTSWSSAELVDSSACCPHVTYASKIIVLMSVGAGSFNAAVRTGT